MRVSLSVPLSLEQRAAIRHYLRREASRSDVVRWLENIIERALLQAVADYRATRASA